MSFDQLMGRLLEETRKPPDANYMSNIYQSINMNSFQMALRSVLVERKETIRANLDPNMYYPPNIVYGMSDILRSNLEHPDLHLNEDEKKDEEIVEMEMRYQQKVKLLKEKLEINLRLVDERSKKHQKKMSDVLEGQMKYRPIDQMDLDRAVATVKYSHDRMKNVTKETATNSIMVMMNEINDTRKRRRNFTKDATDRLQLFFESKQYPSESEKEHLATECNITVQQVSHSPDPWDRYKGMVIQKEGKSVASDLISFARSVANWFGNRRIRLKRCMNKKEQFEGDMKHVYNPDGSIAYISSCKDYTGTAAGSDEMTLGNGGTLDVLDISNFTGRNDGFGDDKVHLG